MKHPGTYYSQRKPSKINTRIPWLTGKIKSGGFHAEPCVFTTRSQSCRVRISGVAEGWVGRDPETVWLSHGAEEKMKAQKVNCFAHKTQDWEGWGSGCPVLPVLFLLKGERTERTEDD